MALKIVWETLFLYLLGSAGWALFSRLRVPVAPFLGSLAAITVLRALGMDIPLSPAWLFPFLQVLIGIRIGSMVNRKNIRGLRSMILPAILVVLWAQSVIFVMGPVMARLTSLDLHTALLSFSMAGVVEMTIIAMDVNADLGFIILMQMTRLLVTFILFPFMVKILVGREKSEAVRAGKLADRSSPPGRVENAPAVKKTAADFKQTIYLFILPVLKLFSPGVKGQYDLSAKKPGRWNREYYREAGRIIMIFAVAGGGGTIFYYLGVPAGIMVGSMFAIALVSLMGVQPFSLHPRLFNLMLVGMGIVVADNLLPETLGQLTDLHMLMLVAIAITIIFATSFLVALLIHRVSGRDFPTCFLASAPAGLFVMTVLAIKYDKDPFFVSILLLCKVLSLQIIVPFAFMYLV